MRKQPVMALTILSIIVTVAVKSANAQSSSHFMKVTIPFEFAVRDKTLPSGEYIVRRTSSDKPEMLLISSVNPGSDVYILTKNVRAKTRQSESKLVFRYYGDQYFLSQIWEAEDNLGRELSKSRRERTYEREMAKVRRKHQLVTVTAHQRRPLELK